MTQRLVLTAILGLGLLAGACAHRPEPVTTVHMPGQIEAVHAAAFSRDMVLLRVSSNGCTDKDDVKPFITKLKNRAVMTLRRLEEDNCRSTVRDGVLLQWSFDELGLEPGTQVELNNPYMMPREAS